MSSGVMIMSLILLISYNHVVIKLLHGEILMIFEEEGGENDYTLKA